MTRARVIVRVRVTALIGFAIALVLSTADASHAETEEELFDLSLEALLDLQLDQMAITGIHHTHDQGEFMLGYHFMYMGMDGNRDGTTRRSTSDVFSEGYGVAPLEMSMEMHMLHGMYGVTDDLTVLVVLPYIRKSMEHRRRMDGLEFTTRTRGIGDIRAAGLYSVYADQTHRVIAEGGLSFPSGSVSETDRLPGMMGNPGSIQRLPYPMQLGSGTWDLLFGATYLGQVIDWSWGANASGTVRTGENQHDYRLGNEYNATAWGARKLCKWCSGSVRLAWRQWFDIHGADDALNPAMVPTADPNRRAGKRLDLILGANLFTSEGALSGWRLMLEGGLPIYQSLDGPQLEVDWLTSANLEYTF